LRFLLLPLDFQSLQMQQFPMLGAGSFRVSANGLVGLLPDVL
jgi:hypothetical protein